MSRYHNYRAAPGSIACGVCDLTERWHDDLVLRWDGRAHTCGGTFYAEPTIEGQFRGAVCARCGYEIQGDNE